MKTIEPQRLAALGIASNTASTRVLDLGCGLGRHTHALTAELQVSVVGADLNTQDLEIAEQQQRDLTDKGWVPRQLATFVPADACALPFADAHFDAVVCSEVLEHIPDYPTALHEIHRVVRAGGVFAMSVPHAWPEQLCWWLSSAYHRAEGGHIRIFHGLSLRKEIEHKGFRFISQNLAHGLHSPYWWLRCAYGEARADRSRLLALYKRFLEWDIVAQPWLTRQLARLADPLMGKSRVMYFVKETPRADDPS